MIDFLHEFQKIRDKSPRAALFGTNVENCPYTNFCVDSKNCHLVFAGAEAEDCYYGVTILKCKDCVDCHNIRNCTLCYGCIDCENCYNGNFLQDCKDCADCSYCFDCTACEFCFGCVGLRHKKYYIFNEPYSREEYEQKMAEIKKSSAGTTASAGRPLLASVHQISAVEQKFEELKRKTPRIYMRQVNVENSVGDFLVNTKNCFVCYDAKDAQDCLYCDRPLGTKDCVDTANLYKNCELCYEVMSGIELHNANFSFLCWYCHDIEYSMYCFYSHHLFGCVSLSHKEYFILNKKYEKDAWHKTVAEIKDQMRRDGTYGKMFESDFPVEDSIVGDYLS